MKYFRCFSLPRNHLPRSQSSYYLTPPRIVARACELVMADKKDHEMELLEASSVLEKVMMAHGRILSKFWYIIGPIICITITVFNIGWTQVPLLSLVRWPRPTVPTCSSVRPPPLSQRQIRSPWLDRGEMGVWRAECAPPAQSMHNPLPSLSGDPAHRLRH